MMTPTAQVVERRESPIDSSEPIDPLSMPANGQTRLFSSVFPGAYLDSSEGPQGSFM